MSKLRPALTRVRGVHRHKAPTGPCCLVGEEVCELTPRGVQDALRETMVVHHPIDRKVFNGNHVEPIDDVAAVLMREVAATPGAALIDAGHHLAPLGALRRALLR